MKLVFALPLFLFAYSLGAGFSLATEVNPMTKPQEACSTRFARLQVLFKPEARRAAHQATLNQAENIKFSQVFPKNIVAKDLSGVEATVVVVDQASLAAYRKAFDDMWNSRVALGIIPASELKSYRAWLKAKNGVAYPPMDPKQFHIAAVNGRTLAEHFDSHFLMSDYLPYTYGSIADYVATLDTSTKAKMFGLFNRGFSRLGLFASGAVATALLVVQGELTGPLISWVKDLTRSTTQSVVDQVNLEVRKVFDGGKDAFVDALLNLNQLYGRISADSFELAGQRVSDIKKRMDGYREEASRLLRRFRPLVLIADKDFDKNSREALQTLSLSLDSRLTNYNNFSLAVDQIKRAAEARGGMLTAAEMNDIARYTSEMERSEEVIALGMAQYAFYLDTMDPKDPLPRQVKQRLDAIMASYEGHMNLDKFRKYYAEQLESHYKKLEALR